MAEEQYLDYLAAKVLTESKPVTYRSLSRALNIHVTTAKQMLYDFHTTQNQKKVSSVHATYIVSGTKKSTTYTNGDHGRDQGNATIPSSPGMLSMSQTQIAVDKPTGSMTVTLVREEELQAHLGEFEDEGQSRHVYSVEPGPIENLSILSMSNPEVADQDDSDPMKRWKLYGSIQNPYVKRRTTKYEPPKISPHTKTIEILSQGQTSVSTTDSKNSTVPMRKGDSQTVTIAEHASRPAARTPAQASSQANTSSKDKATGDIFKSFAKAKTKPKEPAIRQDPTPESLDDVMQGMSEDEGPLDEVPEVKFDENKNAAARKLREERADRLRKMMEDSDEEMTDAPVPSETQDETGSPSNPQDQGPNSEESAPATQSGRRRGRRRVIKKKKVKDSDGYLVTREEAVWESFSEDEPDTKRLKPAPSKVTNTTKAKPTSKKGQGSIASFFKKA